jgi:hypothetical protein
VAPGGWVSYLWRHRGRPKGLEVLADALVRFEERDDGRLEPMELHLHLGDEPVTAAGLRAVPLGRITAWTNAPPVAARIREHIHERVVLPGPDDFATMHSRGFSARPLRIPDRPYGDDFYRQVAAAYSALAEQVARPAAELAEVNDVPVSSVHSWVKEARKRGFLGPGRKGKAG